MLELRNIYLKGDNRFRLKNINLSISYGEKVALLGSSGSGKSTLISVANGSLAPDGGKVMLYGVENKKLKPRQRAKIATLWQDLRLVEELNVAQNINCGALGRHNIWWALLNLIALLDRDLCIACLDAAGLSREYLTANVRELSGGQRQRVAIARSIRQHSDLLLADEPLTNLDPKLINETLRLLLRLEANSTIQAPKTVLISLHRPELIMNFSRIIIFFFINDLYD